MDSKMKCHISGFARPTYPYIDELKEELFYINSCDCCVKGWGESNEFDRCDCWCIDTVVRNLNSIVNIVDRGRRPFFSTSRPGTINIVEMW